MAPPPHNPPDDFASPEQTEATAPQTPVQQSKIPVIVWILGGLGCGGLGLLVLGIIAAIALPSFLNQGARAKETQGLNMIGSTIRGQQAYFLETGEFANTLEELELGLGESEDLFYAYNMVPGSDPTSVFIYATPKDGDIRGFVGTVYATEEAVAQSGGICESNERGARISELPTVAQDATEVICPPGSSLVN